MPIEPMPTGPTKTNSTIILTFNCDVEVQDRARFQEAGHFVPGNVTGPVVWAYTLTMGGVQIARGLGNSADECETLIEDRIRDLVASAARQSAINQFTYQQFMELVNERARLAMFITQNYAPGTTGVPPLDPIATAIHYLRLERRRYSVRLRALLSRLVGGYKPQPLPSDSNEWLPSTWRKD